MRFEIAGRKDTHGQFVSSLSGQIGEILHSITLMKQIMVVEHVLLSVHAM